MPQYKEIEDVEPIVVDLTINHDHPILSVRMPIYKMVETYDRFYLELLYKMVDLKVSCQVNLSPELLKTLSDSREAMDALPLMQPGQAPTSWSLGPIEHLYTATRKLKEFDNRKEWAKHLGQYQPRH